MTKTELAKQVAAAAGLTGEQAKSAVDAVFDTIAGELAAGRDVAIAGVREVQRRRPRRPRGTQPRDGRDDPDRRQPCREVLRGLGAQAAAQRLSRGPAPGAYRAPGPSPTPRR